NWNPFGDLLRYRKNTMAVPMNQVSGQNPQTSDFYWSSEFNKMDVSMRNGHIAGEQIEAVRFQGYQVSNRSVCHRPDTLQGFQNAHMHTSQERTETGIM